MLNFVPEMTENGKGVSAELFYGAKSAAQVRMEALLKKSQTSTSFIQYPSFMRQLLGPSRTWKVFKKQLDAINFCIQRRSGLMCFAYEQKQGQRLFLVAHPKVFWAENIVRFFKDCSTYEIIQEYAVCKLYFDLEFEYEFNKDSHGDRMLKNFLHIVNFNLSDIYGVICTVSDILDLDSSNEKKYSHHVIYQIPNTAFQDNYKAGNFVRRICNELKTAFQYRILGIKDGMNKLAAKYNLSEEYILELFVYDMKAKSKLFVDEGVYTKNRHFRLFGSTKMNKNSPLVIGKNNMYKPGGNDGLQLHIFLDSLITYFSNNITRILEYDELENYEKVKKQQNPNQNLSYQVDDKYCPLYPEIDKFICSVISPKGGIRRKSFFSATSRIIYDIYGYRYCDNIKRHHKSNNIMFIVDLVNLNYYQKCHDSECANFRSQAKKLPDEICFQLEDDSEFPVEANNCEDVDVTLGNLQFEEEHIEILSCLEDLVRDSEF